MSIYDCFIFSHELDLLEIRLGILENVVDYFIIVESEQTFSGKPKPLFFKENRRRFKKWNDKIIYHVIDIPNYENAWDRESFSRNAPINAVKYNDNDIIMSSDLDEIPRPEIVKKLPSILSETNGHVIFKQSMYIYYLNNFETDEWYGTRAVLYKNMIGKTLQDIRHYTEKPNNYFNPIIEDGGWHFTSCGDEELIKRKIQSFSHSELDREDILNNIKNNIQKNTDIYYRDKSYCYVPLNDSFPEYILQNKERYAHIIHDV